MYDVFSLPDFNFPEGFLWGSATAGHQIEGDNIHSDAWHQEQKDQRDEPSGKACDNWRLFREDALLVASLGHQAYRYSIEWSRVEPEEGRFDQPALDHYKEMSELFRQLGIKTFVTLNHFAAMVRSKRRLLETGESSVFSAVCGKSRENIGGTG